MSGLNNLQVNNSRPKEVPCSTTKQQVMKVGLEFLHGVGVDHICKVCIPNGGSCCIGCRSIKDEVGCQARNTSCTAWLCGFLKYIFYEAGLFDEWEKFWRQVPGRAYREDFTPDDFTVRYWLESPKIRLLSKAFADDLKELNPIHNPFWLLEIKETLDRYIDNIVEFTDSDMRWKYEKELKYLTKDFRRLHQALGQL